MSLSRFLYMNDEIICSFLDCLIRQRNEKEAYYWIAEYYYSGFKEQTWKLLWQIYYDFYAIHFPKLESLIKTQFIQWKTKNSIQEILIITKNLYYKKANCNVFLFRTLSNMPIKKIISYRGRSPSWIKTFEPIYKNILLSIHKKHIPNICYYIHLHPPNQLYPVIIRYFKMLHSLNLNEEKYLDSIPYINKLHIILALIIYLDVNEKDIHLDESILEVEQNVIQEVELRNKKKVYPRYKTLPQKRLFCISDKIGCFQLARFDAQYPEYHQLLWYHWEYFASFSPIWKKRFNIFGAIRNTTDYTMKFPNDDALEDFGELYNYEPDEQKLQVQEQSLCAIQKQYASEWIEDMFDNEPIITLPNNIFFPPYFKDV